MRRNQGGGLSLTMGGSQGSGAQGHWGHAHCWEFLIALQLGVLSVKYRGPGSPGGPWTNARPSSGGDLR